MLTSIGRKLLFITPAHASVRISPLHNGFLIGIYHLLLVNCSILLMWFVPTHTVIWAVTLVAVPVLSVLLWLWLTQSLLTNYRTIGIHDALLIAKWSSWPLVGLLIVCGLLLLFYQFGVLHSSTTALFAYFGFLSSVGLLFVCFTLIPFSLRHSLMK